MKREKILELYRVTEREEKILYTVLSSLCVTIYSLQNQIPRVLQITFSP